FPVQGRSRHPYRISACGPRIALQRVADRPLHGQDPARRNHRRLSRRRLHGARSPQLHARPGTGPRPPAAPPPVQGADRPARTAQSGQDAAGGRMMHKPIGLADRFTPATIGIVAGCTAGNFVSAAPVVNATFATFLLPISTEFGWPRAWVTGALT